MTFRLLPLNLGKPVNPTSVCALSLHIAGDILQPSALKPHDSQREQDIDPNHDSWHTVKTQGEQRWHLSQETWNTERDDKYERSHHRFFFVLPTFAATAN